MRRVLVCIWLMVVSAGFILRGQGISDRARRLIEQGDSLHRAYLFDDAIDKYMQAAEEDIDEKTRTSLMKKAQEAQYAINMTEFCAEPHVVGRQRFHRKDFFQYYPLRSQGWHSSPNPLDSLDGYRSYGKKYTYTFDGDDQLLKLNEGISELASDNQQLRKRLKDLKSRMPDELEGDKS